MQRCQDPQLFQHQQSCCWGVRPSMLLQCISISGAYTVSCHLNRYLLDDCLCTQSATASNTLMTGLRLTTDAHTFHVRRGISSSCHQHVTHTNLLGYIIILHRLSCSQPHDQKHPWQDLRVAYAMRMLCISHLTACSICALSNHSILPQHWKYEMSASQLVDEG